MNSKRLGMFTFDDRHSGTSLQMELTVQFSEHEEERALPILLRHSPGIVLPNRVYVLNRAAIEALHDSGISFRTMQQQNHPPTN